MSSGRHGISLATMDMSKGMEWPAVLVADASDHIIPGPDDGDDPALMAVEQGLFYSALTRAGDWYALYWLGGGTTGPKPLGAGSSKNSRSDRQHPKNP